MTALFFRIMEFSVYGSLWLLLVFLVSFFIGKKSGVWWQYFVFVCIAVHLVIPVHIHWLSVDVPFLYRTSQEIPVEAKWEEDTLVEWISGEAQIRKSDARRQGIQENLSQVDLEDQVVGGDSNQQEQQDIQVVAGRTSIQLEENSREGKRKFYLIDLMEMVWIVGMLCFFGRTILSYLVFCKQANRWGLPENTVAKEVLEDVKGQYHIRRKIVLRRNSKVNSPMLYGILNPVILLPDEKYSRQEYDYIFRHELSHYRRGDIWMKYLFTICKGVYWFHPLVWEMCRRAYAQMELLCDEAVVAGKGMEEKREYSMVILRHMTGGAPLGGAPLTTSFYGGKDYMKMRFQNIMNAKKKTVGIGAVLAVVVLVLVLGGVKWSNAARKPEGSSGNKTGTAKKEFSEETVSDKTILVIGTDVNGTNEKAPGYADAILLVDVDAEEGIVAVHNIPRELLVDFKEVASKLPGLSKKEREAIADVGKGTLGTAYMAYGYGVLAGAIERLYDVKVDSHVVLNYNSVPKMIDAAGGVEITLTKQEADYLNKTNYISNEKNRNVREGKQRLNGDQATGYMRIRKQEAGSPVVDGEKSTEKDVFGRSQRCNNVIQGLEKQIRNNTVDWKAIIKSLVQGKEDTEIEVDLSAKELILLVDKLIAGELKMVFTGTEAADYESGRTQEGRFYLQQKKSHAVSNYSQSKSTGMAD